MTKYCGPGGKKRSSAPHKKTGRHGMKKGWHKC